MSALQRHLDEGEADTESERRRVVQEALTKYRIVLVSDVCLSTKYLLDLEKKDRIRAWVRFFGAYGEEVRPTLRQYEAETYKFQGDGWIYFLRPSMKYEEFVLFLRKLVAGFYKAFDSHVTRRLSSRPEVKGLTFGADLGQLYAIPFGDAPEWVGRPLNVACRLQGAIKDPPPGAKTIGRPYVNQALLSAALDSRWHPHYIRGQAKVHRVRRILRNIAGFELRVVPKLSLPGPFNPALGPRSSARKKG